MLSCKSLPDLTPQESAVLSQYHEGLKYLAVQSPTAQEILGFYEQNIVLAKVVSDKIISLEDSKTSGYFVVYVIIDAKPGVRHSLATFDYETRLLCLYANHLSRLIHGLTLCHEMTHAFDCITGREGPSRLFSADWLAGEYRAYQTVYSVLNEITDNRWDRIVQESATDRNFIALEKGNDGSLFVLGSIPGDSLRLASLFTYLSYDDLSVLAEQLCFDANIFRIAMIPALSDSSRSDRIYDFVDAFFYTVPKNL
ncbi:MAG: hypothetical protein V1838_05550 [Patescibacteria group bacterium]